MDQNRMEHGEALGIASAVLGPPVPGQEDQALERTVCALESGGSDSFFCDDGTHVIVAGGRVSVEPVGPHRFC